MITALENIIFDTVMTTPTVKPRRTDTSSSMDNRMATTGECTQVAAHRPMV